jgi:hypothetical protein
VNYDGKYKVKDEIRIGDYTMYYSGGERPENGVAIVAHEKCW